MQTQTSSTLHNVIMEAGGKDRPPLLAPGNYVKWKFKIKRYIDTKPNHELSYYCLKNPPYEYKFMPTNANATPVTPGSEAKAVRIILTGIDNEIYSTVDACPNAMEMWKAIERLKQGKSLESYYSCFYKIMNELVRNKCIVTKHQVNVQFLLQLNTEWQRFATIVKQNQDLKNVSYHKLYDILKQRQNEVNETRAERLAHTANPLALVSQQQPANHPQSNPTHYTQSSSNKSQAAMRNRGKAIANSPPPTFDSKPK
ncbi:hypothetical protein Tco_1490070, partial [Tanacetum coccineum]